MKKIETLEKLFDYMENSLNARSFNLEEGFEKFESDTLATSGSCSPNDLQFQKFEWVDNNGKDLIIEIALVYDSEKDLDYYVIDNVL